LADDAFEAISLNSPAIDLAGPDARFQILVDGRRAADKRLVDLTSDAEYRSLTPAIVSVTPSGMVVPQADGAASIEVSARGKTLPLAVTVKQFTEPRHFNFENDIVPLLSKYGCNSSGCHGKAEGQNGFKLSVFGFDPPADYAALTKEGRGRRVFPALPDQSLVLTKASGQTPHGGGIRMTRDSHEYAVLRDWIAAGLPIGSNTDPKVAKIEVQPHQRQLAMSARQQLRVVATYTDGRELDVTSLSKFQSNNDGLASVDELGLVTAGKVPGQVAVMAAFMGEVDVFEAIVPRAEAVASAAKWPEHNFIDGLVYDKLRKLGIQPSELSTDAEYLRRVYLDIIGTLPTPAEAERFLADKRDDKRARLVDELLARPEYADYWSLKWSDLLRVDRAALGHKNAYIYYRWIRDRLAENQPLDQFASQLVTAEGPLSDVPQANLYKVVRTPGDMASTLSQVFLGVRISCAQCHHHPYDRWSQTDYYGMLSYFAPVGQKQTARGDVVLVSGSPQSKHPRTGDVVLAHPLGMPSPDPATMAPVKGDQRVALAAWMTAPSNPWFAKNWANRFWKHFAGRGLVEPVDDVRATNPPSNPQLLDALAKYLVDHKFDQRELIKAIVASRVYQHSSQSNPSNEHDELNYSRALLKRMDAEVLLDAVCQTTGVPEKFQGMPSGYRAIQLWDSKATHDFLTLFGRPTRQTACECERNAEPSVGQVLHFLNGPNLHNKLVHEAGNIAELVKSNADNGQLADTIYLTFYSRYPSADERKVAVDYLDAAGSPAATRRKSAEDLAWSLMNTLEFVFNH